MIQPVPKYPNQIARVWPAQLNVRADAVWGCLDISMGPNLSVLTVA